MDFVDRLAELAQPWASLYGDTPALQTALTFVHLAGIFLGGGFAIATDRETFVAMRAARLSGQIRHLAHIHTIHRPVLLGLVMALGSGVLLWASDIETGALAVYLRGELRALARPHSGRYRADGLMSNPSCLSCGALASRRDFLHTLVWGLALVPLDALRFPVRLGAALRLFDQQAVYPIPAQDGATINKENEVILVRYQDRIYAFGLSCPHQRTPLRWQEEQRRFQCPKHKSTFQPDGAFLEGRATRSMDRYPSSGMGTPWSWTSRRCCARIGIATGGWTRWCSSSATHGRRTL